jgi:type II secretory pathway component GspD/PulD (secretin)
MHILILSTVLATVSVLGQAQIQVNARFVEYPAGGSFDARVQSQLKASQNGVIDAEQLTALLANAAEAAILSAPKVTTLAGQKAEIKIVEERFFTPDEPTEIGISLEVTPTLADSAIELDTRARIVEFLGFKDANNSPILRARVIERKVALPPGQVVLLPGPAYEEEVVTTDCVPLLGSIPLLGRLFRCKRTTTVTRNLLLTISAEQIGTDGT